MKAVIITQYGSPDVLKLKEIEKPIPTDNEVLVRIYGSIVGATDPVSRTGKPLISRFASGFLKPKNPIPGDVLSGEIEMIGKSVTKFKVGDQIFAATCLQPGTHAEYKCIKENGSIALKPATISFCEAAALCDGALTALPFLRDNGKIKENQNVLIYGASGAVGTAAVQLAKYYQTTVTAVCSTDNLEMVKSIGADNVIDYTKEDFTKTGQQYDIIFDVVAKSSFSKCKKSLSKQGVYLTTFPTPASLFHMLLTLKGKGKKSVFAATGLRAEEDKQKDLNFIKGLVESGKLISIIDRVYTLEQVAEAHRYVEKGHKKGNVALVIE